MRVGVLALAAAVGAMLAAAPVAAQQCPPGTEFIPAGYGKKARNRAMRKRCAKSGSTATTTQFCSSWNSTVASPVIPAGTVASIKGSKTAIGAPSSRS